MTRTLVEHSRLLNEAIDAHFKRRYGHIYTLWVVNNRWNHEIGFYLDDMPHGVRARHRNIPLYTLHDNSDWTLLEQLMELVHAHTKISVVYKGWRPVLDRWPESGNVIIKRPKKDDYTPDDIKPGGRYSNYQKDIEEAADTPTLSHAMAGELEHERQQQLIVKHQDPGPDWGRPD